MAELGVPGHVRKQVMSRPALLREFAPKFDRQVREVLDHQTCLNIARVFGFGCGDSHNAAVATRMAFHEWARIPMQALTAMEFARYTTPWLDSRRPHPALAIGISVSGEVARTVEGLALAREAEAYTLAITCNPNSRVSEVADMTVDVAIPDMDIPRVRTYVATQIAMYMVALRLAEVRGEVGHQQGRAIRGQFDRAAEIGEATHDAVSESVHQLARELNDRDQFCFVGGGPNYGSAMFGAAKILEAVGCHAQPQDLEEWVHLQRFLREAGTPIFLLAPPGLAYTRAVEVARVMKKVEAFLVAVVEEGEEEISTLADVVLPVKGSLPEELTPLVYTDAVEMFASDLAELRGEAYFRGFEGRWETPDGDPIWFNEVIETRHKLKST